MLQINLNLQKIISDIHLPPMYSYMAILKKIGVGCALFSNMTVHYSEYESFQKFKEAQIWTTD